MQLTDIRKNCALQILRMHKNANSGHIGSSLSCLEILIDIYFNRMTSSDDLTILSKGHAASALYTVLAAAQKIPQSQLDTFYQNGTQLAAHPPCSSSINAIPFGTGSLGHGLSLANGISLSQRFTQKNFQVFAVLSEGDCNEGSTWEAALFAGHHRLSNLTVILDLNGLQGIGRSSDILDLGNIERKWSEFGFATQVCENGNDFKSLHKAHTESYTTNKPKCIIAQTTKGAGVSFMEDNYEWHYWPMTDEHYSQAITDVSKGL